MSRRHRCHPRIRRLQAARVAIALAAAAALSAPVRAQTAGAGATATPATAAASLPDANLLDYADGTIVRSYSPAMENVARIADGAGSLADGAKGPYRFVYELPGVATLSRLAITLAATDPGVAPVTVDVAVSTTSAAEGFHDVGRVRSGPDDAEQVLGGAAHAAARWIRFDLTVPPGVEDLPIEKIVANGALAPRPAGSPPPGGVFWALGNDLYADGGVRNKPAGDPADYGYLVVTRMQDDVNAMSCNGHDQDGAFENAYPGRLAGRVWSYRTGDGPGKFVLNDEGSILAGAFGGEFVSFVRADGVAAPAGCAPEVRGAGATSVLVLGGASGAVNYPNSIGDDLGQSPFRNFRFTLAGAPLLTPALLAGASSVDLSGVCSPATSLDGAQGALLSKWVAAGHKLLIHDADMCRDPVRYDFLPYRFRTDNPGAKGASGKAPIIVENDTLGTTDKGDAEHYVDAPAYWNGSDNDLGDANEVVSEDPHWCGHLFGTNADGVNGYQQVYAVYGKGLIIYEGFDLDDAHIPTFQAYRRLEYAQDATGMLPCSRGVAAGFVILPDRTLSFTPGKAAKFVVPLTVYSNQGWKGHVALAVGGRLAATVAPAAFAMPPAARTLSVAIEVPADATAARYTVAVEGSGSGSRTARATIMLVAAKPDLAETLARQCKVAIYGINFDFDKATLRSDSESVLERVLKLFKDAPTLAVEIGGHTDNVGTPAYNLTLSEERAEAVKAWLVAHGVAASRLTAHGYGDTMPVAPNTIEGKDNPAGRALNRRVELKRPDCKP